MFPQITASQYSILLDLYNHNDTHVIEVLLQGITLSSLLSCFKQKNMVASPKFITVRHNHIVQDGLRLLYKCHNFNITSPIEVEIEDAPAVDLGGPRRQFFTEFLRDMPKELKLIEENGAIHFLTCNTDSVLCRHYARFAQFIVYSVLQEGPGYPHLPKALYYYLVGGVDMAIEHLSLDELPLATQYVVEQVYLHVQCIIRRVHTTENMYSIDLFNT